MQVVVFYKHVLVLKNNDSIFLTLKVAQYLKEGLYDEIFLSQVVNFSTIMKVFQKKTFLPDF